MTREAVIVSYARTGLAKSGRGGFNVTPVVSMAIGWLWMGDVLTPQILAGSALTIAGVAAVALAERGLRAGANRG